MLSINGIKFYEVGLGLSIGLNLALFWAFFESGKNLKIANIGDIFHV